MPQPAGYEWIWAPDFGKTFYEGNLFKKIVNFFWDIKKQPIIKNNI